MSKRDTFPVKLKSFMDKAGINQVGLAAAVNVSKSTVHCWLTGKAFPRVDVIQRIADTLACDFDDLFAEAMDEDDEELTRLWSDATHMAKQAALAVLKAMKDLKE